MVECAKENPDISFISMTGDFAAISGVENFSNGFTGIYQSRYVSGFVAGMKLKELVDAGTISKTATPNAYDANGKIKIGYVGAFPYAEVVSGYTAFFLGIQSVYADVAMTVQYTNSWFDLEAENTTAKALIAMGCVIIGQHADSTGAPSACEEAWKNGTVVYSIGYNVDMLTVAPNAALTSATNTWSVYYEYALRKLMNGEKLEKDLAFGYKDGGVDITALGKNCAAGTQEKVDATVAGIKDGSIKVFDITKFTVGGEKITSAQVDLSYIDWSTGSPVVVYQGETVEAVENGEFVESKFRSAPYFALRIDGITELTTTD